MSKSRKVIVPDSRNRIALGDLVRHELYFANVDTDGVIVLTPAQLIPIPAPKKRTRRPANPRPATPEVAE